MAAPIDGQTCHPNHPAGKTVLPHRTPVISERLSKSAGFCDRQSLQLRWDDFFLWCLALTAFHIPGKAPGTYRHRLYGLPRIPLPGHTRKITFVTMMSTIKFSLQLELVFAGILFLILLTIGCKEKIEVNNNYCPIPGASQPKEQPKTIVERIGEPAFFEQLAEECSELAQAALKSARKYRGENPTPKTIDECYDALQEEIADVMLIGALLIYLFALCCKQISGLWREQK